MAQLLRALRIAALPHGFRSNFGDWASEETDYPREVAEAALAHNVHNPIRGGIPAHGPVRAAAPVDGRRGELPGSVEAASR